MPFNDLAQSSSAKRGFADLFADSKAALDNIQAGLGGMLPSMPGMPVAKFGDLSIGIDMHPTVTPPSLLCRFRMSGKSMTLWRILWRALPLPYHLQPLV